jgi:hypothetical protein
VCCAQLKHLHKLDLSGNNITAVPSGIGALSELQELRWGHNNLVTLPGEIGQLRQLQLISLEENALVGSGNGDAPALPREFCKLGNLTSALLRKAFAYNPAKGVNKLPDCFGQLSSLQTLVLQGNHLEELKGPNTVVEVDLSHNDFREWPSWINANDVTAGGELPLKSLNMEHNQLTHLPGKDAGLPPGLRDLRLANNPLVTGDQNCQECTISGTRNSLIGKGGLISELTHLRNFTINVVADPSAELTKDGVGRGGNDGEYELHMPAPCRVGQPEDGADEPPTECKFRIQTHVPSNGGLKIYFTDADIPTNPNVPASAYFLTDNHDGTYDGAIPGNMVPHKGRYSFRFYRTFPGHPGHPLDNTPDVITISRWSDGSLCKDFDCFKDLEFSERNCYAHGPYAVADTTYGTTCVCPSGTTKVKGVSKSWQCERNSAKPCTPVPCSNATIKPNPCEPVVKEKDVEVLDVIKRMSGGQVFLLVLFMLLSIGAAAVAVVQSLRLRALRNQQKQGLHEGPGINEAFMSGGSAVWGESTRVSTRESGVSVTHTA